ncbi:hypothetical protein GCM10027341_35450 [Spirosoma knui]
MHKQSTLGRFLIFQLGLLLISMTAMGQAQSNSDFRQIRWGYTPKQVREAELPLKPNRVKKEKVVYSGVELASRRVGLDYDFTGDSLLSATYFYYSTVSVTEADVRAAASEFETLLTEKYGPGKTASVGGIKQLIWLTPRTQISLSLGNVDKGWSLEVMYLCRVCSGEVGSKQADKQPWKARKEIVDF